METNEKQNESIGLYLQGRLKGEDLSNFLKEVEGNNVLKEELRIQQAIADGVEHKNNKELRERFKQIATEVNSPKKDAKLIKMPVFKIIASVAAMALLCFSAYFLLNTQSSSDAIFANYFEPSELTITRSTDLDADLVNLKEFYNTKAYDKALPLFEKIIKDDPTSSNLRLAYGSTLLKCKKIEKARAQFTQILNTKDPLFSDQSRWYLGLLELQAGNVEKAKAFLTVLINDSNSDFHDEAKRMLEELRELKD